jgi:hypothetical protein
MRLYCWSHGQGSTTCEALWVEQQQAVVAVEALEVHEGVRGGGG